MKIDEMNIAEIDARLAEIGAEVETRSGDELDALKTEVEQLQTRRAELEGLEKRMAIANQINAGAVAAQVVETSAPANENEQRAQAFVDSHHVEMRAVLASGQIATPTNVGGINGLGAVGNGIVDDVNAIALTGAGAWKAAYKKTDAEAAAVTDGQKIGGTASTYGYVTVNPDEWGVLDEVSKQVAKLTPLSYLQAVSDTALIALRSFAANKIVTNVLASALIEEKTVALDADFLRTLVLGFRPIEGKGAAKLYISQADLAVLGKVRGTNEKKPLYEIAFDPGTVLSGTISEGGLATPFRILDQLSAGTQLYGQPGAIDMPMWDNYSVETDEGGEYFARNMICVRGLQTANADLVAYHGMQKIANA